MTATRILALAIALATWSPTQAKEPTPTALEAFASAPDTRIKQEIDARGGDEPTRLSGLSHSPSI